MTDAKSTGPVSDMTGKRLLYRATHRGTRELDLMLGSFARAHLPRFSDTEMAQFDRMLRLEEADLQVWLLGQEEIPAGEHEPMLRRVRTFCLRQDGGLAQ